MKIGILGGTFNPIHLGHMIIAENAYDEFGLDEVWFMPAYIPPHKRGEHILDNELRLKMVECAVADHPHFKAFDYEIRKADVSYTSETLKFLRTAYPDYTFYFIMGADSLFAIDTWHHPREIFRDAALIAAAREDIDLDLLRAKADELTRDYGARIYIESVPKIDISSTMIRKRVAEGRSIEFLVPDRVREFIYQNQIYADKKASTGGVANDGNCGN